MELMLVFNKKPYLLIKYSKEEWEALENLYKKLDLERSTTRYGLGAGLQLEYYRESDTELYNYLRETLQMASNASTMCCADNINEPAITSHGYFNLAILRIIPDQNYTVTIPLPKFLAIHELNTIVKIITKIMEVVMNVIFEAKIIIKPRGGGQSENN